MDANRKSPAQRFRFLDDEQFGALNAKEKMAYLTAATGELQRIADGEAPPGASRRNEPRPE